MGKNNFPFQKPKGRFTGEIYANKTPWVLSFSTANEKELAKIACGCLLTFVGTNPGMQHKASNTYQILQRFKCAAYLTIITPLFAIGQDETLKLINKPAQYSRLIRMDSLQEMVPLRSRDNGITIDLRYASPDNFTKTQLYPQSKNTYLKTRPAAALKEIQAVLARQDIGIKVWDAYRPYRVTKRMWELIGDERYVANPAKGSGHNRGIAVDLTLFDLRNGKELDMGTPFDHFGEEAHHDFKGLTPKQNQNRTLLKTVMEQYGFKALPTEWWHYSWPEPAKYPLMNLTFGQLKKLTD